MSAVEFTTTVTTRMEMTACCACGVAHMLTEGFIRRRREDHAAFYCPNGHSQSFPQETEADRLRTKLRAAELETQRQVKEVVRLAALAAERTAAVELAERELMRLQTRAAHGVCPCCHRTFKQLARHMTSKHPEQMS